MVDLTVARRTDGLFQCVRVGAVIGCPDCVRCLNEGLLCIVVDWLVGDGVRDNNPEFVMDVLDAVGELV